MKKIANEIFGPGNFIATTAHAVMAQNAEDGGNRQFIMVQLPQPIKSESKWEKAQGVLKWIAEKGFEVGKIALPYVLQAVFNTPT